jgi:hypothetical protein
MLTGLRKLIKFLSRSRNRDGAPSHGCVVSARLSRELSTSEWDMCGAGAAPPDPFGIKFGLCHQR